MKRKFKAGLPHFTFGMQGAAALFLGALVAVFVMNGAGLSLSLMSGKAIVAHDAYLIISNAVIWMAAIFAFDYFICRKQTGMKLNFNLSAKNFSTYAFVFPLMAGMMLIADFVTAQIPVTGPFFGPMYEFFSELMEKMTSDTATLFILAVVMAPLFEEIVFRGIMQKGMINGGMKPTSAIWISAILFGLVHANIWQFTGAVLLGYVLGLVYHRTKSLLMPILLHAFNNFVSLLLIHYTDTESFADAFGVSSYILLAAGIALFGIFYYFFTEKYEIAHAED